MNITTINIHMDDPDVRVQIHKGGQFVGKFATLDIDQIAFFIDPLYADVETQLDKIEKVGRRIIEAVAKAREPEVAA